MAEELTQANHEFTDEPPPDPPSVVAENPSHTIEDSPTKHTAQNSVDTVSSLATIGASTDLLSTDTTPKTKTSFSSVDTRTSELSNIEQHRLQQVASTGQLKPRHAPQLGTPKPEDVDNVPPIPQIRLQQISDNLEEQDLGLLRTDTRAYSFEEGRPDTLHSMGTPPVADTQDNTKKSHLRRPYFARIQTEPLGYRPSMTDLFRTPTWQPQQADYAGLHPLKRVKARLGRESADKFQAVQTYVTADIALRSNQELASTSRRTPRKLQKKERTSQSSLRQKFMAARISN